MKGKNIFQIVKKYSVIRVAFSVFLIISLLSPSILLAQEADYGYSDDWNFYEDMDYGTKSNDPVYTGSSWGDYGDTQVALGFEDPYLIGEGNFSTPNTLNSWITFDSNTTYGNSDEINNALGNWSIINADGSGVVDNMNFGYGGTTDSTETNFGYGGTTDSTETNFGYGGTTDSEEINFGYGGTTDSQDIVAVEEGGSFPWYLGLLAVPLLFNRSSDNTTVIQQATPTPLAQNTVCPAPTFNSNINFTGIVGTPLNFNITTSGQAPINVTSSNLPSGLTISNGVISGTPTIAGTFVITMSATNACGSATQTIVIVINQTGTPPPTCPTGSIPVISAPSNINGVVGSFLSLTISATGQTPITYSASNLPAGLSFNNGVIFGTPTHAGTYTINVTATNACGSDTNTIVIVVNPTGNNPCPVGSIPVITTGNNYSLSVGNFFSLSLSANSNTNVSWSASGLPSGLSLNGNVISGTPNTAGVFTININATNSCGSDSQTILINITGQNTNPCPVGSLPVITSSTFVTGYVNQSFSYQINATNNPSSYNASNLPNGLFMNSNGFITGTPTNAETRNVTIYATNACGTGSATLIINVNQTIYYPPTNPPYYPPYYPPNVILQSEPHGSVYLAQTPGGIYLSQVPYTGVGDVTLTIIYLLGLLIAASALAYVSVYGTSVLPIILFFKKLKAMFTFGKSAAAYKTVASITPLPIAPVIASAVVSAPIVATPITIAPITAIAPVVRTEDLILEARTLGALLSKEASEIILGVADGKFGNALTLLIQIINAEKVNTPEDRLVVLSVEKVNQRVFEAYLSLIPVFARWIEDGMYSKANAFLQKIEKQGLNAREFLAKAESEFSFVSNFAYVKNS